MNKKRDYITVTADVDVYLDDYFDDFMDLASDEDLIQEIENEGIRYIRKNVALPLLENSLLNLIIQPI